MRSFDPASAGARRLARDWGPHLERWEMRIPDRHFFAEGDGTVIQPGQAIEVGAPEGRQLAEHGYELVGVRRVRAAD